VYPPTTYTVAIDPSLAPEDAADAIQAMDDWTNATGVVFDRHVGPPPADITLTYGPAHFTETPYLYLSGPMAGQVAGSEIQITGPYGAMIPERWGWGGRIELYVQARILGPAMFTELVEHELGHAMGLSHHPGSHVMTPVIQAMPISWDDVAQYFEVHSETNPINTDPDNAAGQP
jgi:hypothetical protein